MAFMERKEAKERGLSQYSTGKPCRNGHITHRYTSSGACSGCVNGERGALVAEKHADSLVERQQMGAAMAELVDLKLRVFYEDSAALMQTAEALCVSRFPNVAPELFKMRTTMTGHAAGTAAYRVRIHPLDMPMIRKMADAMVSARSRRTPEQIAQTRALIMGRAFAIASEPEDEVYSRDPT